jgi:two-component system sensor histidine kinase AtoS
MTAAQPPRTLLAMRNIRHVYGEKYALRGVDFDLYPGEVHAIVGDHYSGKSSLAGIVSGELRKQHGSLIIDGREVATMTPRTAVRTRIAIVHQDMTVIPSLNAVENIFAGRIPAAVLSPRRREQMLSTAKRIFRALGVEVNLELPLRALSREERQMTEVARALAITPRIIVLDEISQRFTPQQVDRILLAVRPLMDAGAAVVYITSDIQEVLSRADRVTVLRHGVRRATERVRDLDLFNLLKLTHNFALDVPQGTGEERIALAGRYNEDMIANLSVGVVMLDRNQRIHTLNPAAREMLDVPAPPSNLPPVEELLTPDQPERAAAIRRDIERGVQNTWSEIAIRTRRIVNLKLFPVFEQHAHIGAIILLEDVSVDRSVKEYLARAERVTSIAELAAGVAHEINNPLGIIQNYVQLLKLHEDAEAQQQRLAKIEGELDRIARIVGSLLSFSRLRADARRRLGLRELTEEVLALLGHRINDKHVRVEREMPAEEVVVSGDETRLKQVWMNLIANSVEAVLEHGVIQVGLRVDRNANDKSAGQGTDEAVFTVTDNGHGIPDEVAERVFSPFFTTKTYKKNAGLGLSICQHLIEAHGGKIEFDSVPGAGTTFTVRLPLA